MYANKHPWPDTCRTQHGGNGIVLVGGDDYYRTAFFEAFPRDPDTFIRGEGPTVEAAEDAAWQQHLRHQACGGHEFESRGYKNGAGFCRHCNMFSSRVFTPEQLGLYCRVCGTPTFWHRDADGMLCEAHVRQSDADADTTSALSQLLSRLTLALEEGEDSSES